MEFGKLGRPRRSVSDSAGDHPRIGFRRTSPWLSKCHPNSRGPDGWTGVPSRTDSQRLTAGIDTDIFDMHCPSTFVRGARGVLARNHLRIFDRQLGCGRILPEEFFLCGLKVPSYQLYDLWSWEFDTTRPLPCCSFSRRYFAL